MSRLASGAACIAICIIAAAARGEVPETGAQRAAAFADAQAAVRRALGVRHPLLETLQLHRRVGLKGSTADVVCGDIWRQDSWDTTASITPFIYVWRLHPATHDVGRRQGEVMIIRALGRREIAELGLFCGWANPPRPNPYNYFN